MIGAIPAVVRSTRAAAAHAAASPATLAVGRIYAVAAGVLSAPLLARSLGPFDRGLYAAAASVMILAPVLIGLGVPIAIRRVVAAGTRIGPALRGARILAVLLVGPSALMGYFGSPSILGDIEQSTRFAFAAACGLSALTISWTSDASVLFVRRKFLQLALLHASAPTVIVILLLGGIATGTMTLNYAIAATGAAPAVAALLGFWLVRTGPGWPSAGTSKRLLVEGIKYAPGQIAEAATYRIGLVMGVALIGATETGFYSIAVTAGAIVMAIGQAVASNTFAQVSGLTGAEMAATSTRILRTSAILGAMVGAAGAVLSPIVVPFVFGRAFEPAVMGVVITMAAAPSMMVVSVATSLFIAQGHPGYVASVQFGAIAANLTAFFAFVHLLGPSVAAAASAAATASWIGLLIVVCLGRYKNIYKIRVADFSRALRLVLVREGGPAAKAVSKDAI